MECYLLLTYLHCLFDSGMISNNIDLLVFFSHQVKATTLKILDAILAGKRCRPQITVLQT